jgi:putative peptidoglycan lipid II flippase
MTQQTPMISQIVPGRARGWFRLFRMATLLAGGALLGKALGFARELLMARVFGASLIADSFRGSGTAVMMPLVPMQNEGVPAVLIPMHRAWQEQGRAPEKLAALCAGLCLTAALIMLMIEAGGIWWVGLIVGRMEPEGQRLTLDFVRVMAFWMPSSVLLNCLAAAEIATGRSRIAALRPAVLNVCVMTGILLYAATGRLSFLPLLFAVSFNGLGAWSIWTLWREGMLDPAGLRAELVIDVWREFARRLRPLLVQPFAEQGQVWLERVVASGFAIGTLASIDYARTLTDSAMLLVAQPIGMAVLYQGVSSNPRAAALAIAGPVLAVTAPVSVYLFVFAHDIVHLVFARGAFNETAVELTNGALRGVSAGLWAATLGMILLRFLNNAGRNGLAAVILAFALAINALLNLLAWRMTAAGGNGAMLIGLGESARGLTLLVGVSVALNCHWPLLRLAASCIPPAAILGLFCILIQQYWSGSLAHLALGGAACLAAIFLTVLLAAPGQVAAVLKHFADIDKKDCS